jgi:hypothetical protein
VIIYDIPLQIYMIIYTFAKKSEGLWIIRRHHYRWRAAKFKPIRSALRALSREGSLSCHTCCDTGPRFFRFHPKDRPIQSPLTTHKGMWRIYSNPDPHGDKNKYFWFWYDKNLLLNIIMNNVKCTSHLQCHKIFQKKKLHRMIYNVLKRHSYVIVRRKQ